MKLTEIDQELLKRLLDMPGDRVISNEEFLSSADEFYIFKSEQGKQIGCLAVSFRKGEKGKSLFVLGCAALPGHRSLTKKLYPFLETEAKKQNCQFIEAVCALPAQIKQLETLGFAIDSHNLSKQL